MPFSSLMCFFHGLDINVTTLVLSGIIPSGPVVANDNLSAFRPGEPHISPGFRSVEPVTISHRRSGIAGTHLLVEKRKLDRLYTFLYWKWRCHYFILTDNHFGQVEHPSKHPPSLQHVHRRKTIRLRCTANSFIAQNLFSLLMHYI